MSEGLAQRLFSEIANDQGEAYVFNPPDAWLDALPRRVKRGDLRDTPAAAWIETDGRVALRELNRQRLGQMWVQYRRTVGGHPLRGFIPRVVLAPPADAPVPAWGPRAASPWIRAADDTETAIAHAQQRLSGSLETAARLHGAALVALGVCSWEDVKQDGLRQWTQLCDRLATPAAEPVPA